MARAEKRKRKAGDTVSYAQWRADWRVHPKTSGMRPLSYCLMHAAVSSNMLGVLRESPLSLAMSFRDTSPSDVMDCCAELVTRKVAMWWPELECLFVVEALDEQCDNPSAAKGAAKIARTFPREIQSAISDRYGESFLREGLIQAPGHCVQTQVYQGSDTVSDQQQQQQHHQQQQQATAARLVALLNVMRQEFVAGSRLKETSEIIARLREGRTEDEMVTIIEGAAALCRKHQPSVEWFDTITPFRKANFDRSLAKAQVALRKASTSTDMGDLE